MAKRKAIPKKIRFEVFKRDKFTCQYCGKSAPDVVLEIDHIKPVSKGGDNDIMNLVTACKDCNSGKSNRELSDDSVIKKQQAQLQELAERKEQLEMMVEWRNSLNDLENDYVESINDIFISRTEWGMSESGRIKIKKLLKQFSFSEIMDATEIAIDSYYDGTEDSWNVAFRKIGGICYTKRNQKDNPQSYYINYTLKALRNRNYYVNEVDVRRYIKAYINTPEDFEDLKFVISESRNWTDFKRKAMDVIGGNF